MPTYEYQCRKCGWGGDLVVRIKARDSQCCPAIGCGRHLTRQLAAPLGRVAGRPVKGGGADRFTADMLGVPLKELPPGLRQDKGKPTPS